MPHCVLAACHIASPPAERTADSCFATLPMRRPYWFCSLLTISGVPSTATCMTLSMGSADTECKRSPSGHGQKHRNPFRTCPSRPSTPRPQPWRQLDPIWHAQIRPARCNATTTRPRSVAGLGKPACSRACHAVMRVRTSLLASARCTLCPSKRVLTNIHPDSVSAGGAALLGIVVSAAGTLPCQRVEEGAIVTASNLCLCVVSVHELVGRRVRICLAAVGPCAELAQADIPWQQEWCYP